ncbi:MAG: ABC transporter ATP-binding protein [Deltaproteobacteria bacterium]|nr:ABC transporter ATP-binding protein [Deltaproteobacteria bacterium]
MLELSGVRTFYGNIEALKGVSFHIDRQEIIAILGANGAGKTTCLNSIVGLTPPRSGRVVYEGSDIRGRSTDSLVKAGLVMVPEGRRIFPALTVMENLRMGAYLRRDRQGIRDDLDYILSIFPILAARAGQDGGTLSGGEQQMLAISRGLMGRPRMLLLDEPSLGLAPIVIRSIFDTIRKINLEQKTTILLVEQNANLALQVAHRAYIMTTGIITLSGTARELMSDESVKKAYLGG